MIRPSIVALALLLTACGSSSPTAPSGPTFPAVAGVYRNGNAIFQYTLVRLSDNATARLSCGGSVTLTQASNVIGGTFISRDGDCETPSSGVINGGRLNADGGVSFNLNVSGADPNYLTAAFGCVGLSASDGWAGAINGASLDVSATLVMDCPVDGRIQATLAIHGVR
jgi:hypothetical protein